MPGSCDGRHRFPSGLAPFVAIALCLGAVTALPANVQGTPLVLTAASASGCAGSPVANAYSGAIRIAGGPLSPAAGDDVPVNYSFSVTEIVVDRATGAILSSSCEVENGTVTTNASGGFSLLADPPSGHCPTIGGGGECVEYSGPYGPVEASPVGATPSGYTVDVETSGTTFTIEYVALLAGVTLTSSSTQSATSVGAPDTFRAIARNGLGNPSPLEVGWNWTIAGSGWSFVPPTAGATATVRASIASPNGTLAATATASIGGRPWTATSATTDLVAVATTISSLRISTRAADAGQPVTFQLRGTGAAGFNYSASIAPGAGLPEVRAPCAASASPNGTLTIDCAASVTYPTPTNASATARLSNGYSVANGTFGTLPVLPPPALAFVPKDPEGYSGSSMAFGLAAAPGTGVRPFAQACLASGDGPTQCVDGPGPNWTFSASYASPGNYTAQAWAIDADGTNRSVTEPVRIVARPGLSPLTVVGNRTVGAALELSSTLSGGFLPGTGWWNSSTLADPIATEPLGSDGAISISFEPATSGPVRLSLTVVDALGTGVTESLVVQIAPAPAGSLRPLGAAPACTTIVGRPISFAWQAFGPSGTADPGFSSAAELLVEQPSSGAAFPAWVNVSGHRPLLPLGDAAFAVPVAAWADGELNVTVTPAAAGPLSVSIAGTGLAAPNASPPVLVLPDLVHLELHDATVRFAGDRTNATLWQVTDPFGDPVAGAYLAIQTLVGGGASDAIVPVVALPTGASGAWINYSLPLSGGSVRVFDPAGAVVLGPIVVPPLATPAPRSPALVTLGAAVPIGVAVAGLSAVFRRRTPHGSAARGGPMPDPEPDLERLALGRAGVVELVRRAGALGLAGLESGWVPPPAPPDLADWVASLVADGTLGASIGPDGIARFTIAAPPAGPPRVTIDVAAFDRALAHRSAELADRDPSGDAP